MSGETFTRDAPKIVGPDYMVFPRCILYQGVLVDPPVATSSDLGQVVYELPKHTSVVFDGVVGVRE